MIRAHMATFPVRADILPAVIDEICPQVDRLFLVLNEYDEIPGEIASNPKIEAVIPDQDFKDVGKFVFEPAPDDIVFFVDDDISYSPKYVSHSLRLARKIGLDTNVFGYHCSLYKQDLSRDVLAFWRRHREFTLVDQIGTGTLVALGKNVPSLEYMRSSQKFVDVRYAKWLRENGIKSIALKRHAQFLQQRRSDSPEDQTIWETFTKNSPEHVLEEIKSFAGKDPLVGKQVSEVL